MRDYKLAAGLTEFPRALFEHADTLEHLDLSDNQLCSLPEDFGRFSRLKRLFLTNNQFRDVPAVLSQCQALTMVSFKGNQLCEFAPASLPDGLEWLILTDNQLPALPEDMGRYRALKKCALAGNQLTTLPQSMQQCTQLGLLRLSLNQFAAFPDWLFQLPQLAWLALGANPATPVTLHSDIPQHPLSHYQLNDTLGVGASGVISKALHLPSGSECAVKMFKGWVTSDGCPKDEMANALNAGRHANLIPIDAQLTGGELPGLAMALIPPSFVSLGKPPSFATITRDTYRDDMLLSVPELWHLTSQVLAVMAHLHQQQVVHGDLYAHNMLVNPEFQLYLGDFGAATALDALPASQQQQMKQLEVRAFGYWLLDMLSVLNPAESTASLAACAVLEQLAAQCLQPQVTSRPMFSQLVTWLAAQRGSISV